MMNVIRYRPRARRDLVEIFRYFTRKAGVKAAYRFLGQAEVTFKRLANMPGMGAAYEGGHPVFEGVRTLPVSRFKQYMIFYRSFAEGIDIIRVLHGARNIPSILAAEFGLATGDEPPEE